MQGQILVSELKRAVNILALSVFESPTDDNIAISVTAGYVEFSRGFMANSISFRIHGRFSIDGSLPSVDFRVNAKWFLRAVKAISNKRGTTVDFSLVSNMFKFGYTEVEILGDATQYSSDYSDFSVETGEFSRIELLNVLTLIAPVIYKDNVRPQLNKIWFEAGQAIGIDGYQMLSMPMYSGLELSAVKGFGITRDNVQIVKKFLNVLKDTSVTISLLEGMEEDEEIMVVNISDASGNRLSLFNYQGREYVNFNAITLKDDDVFDTISVKRSDLLAVMGSIYEFSESKSFINTEFSLRKADATDSYELVLTYSRDTGKISLPVKVVGSDFTAGGYEFLTGFAESDEQSIILGSYNVGLMFKTFSAAKTVKGGDKKAFETCLAVLKWGKPVYSNRTHYLTRLLRIDMQVFGIVTYHIMPMHNV